MALFPLYGVVLVQVAERLGRGSLEPPRHRWVRVGARLLLLVLLIAGVSDVVSRLRRSF
jgi:hypothetical protein